MFLTPKRAALSAAVLLTLPFTCTQALEAQEFVIIDNQFDTKKYAGIYQPAGNFDSDISITTGTLPEGHSRIYGVVTNNTITFNGNINIDANASSLAAMAYGFRAETGSNATLLGNTIIHASTLTATKGNDGNAVGVLANNGTIDMSKGNTDITIDVGSSRPFGFQLVGGTNETSATVGKTNIKINLHDKNASDTEIRWAQGIYAANASFIAKDDVSISFNGIGTNGALLDLGETVIRGVNLEGSAYNTNAQFDKNLSIAVNGKGYEVYGVYVSGDTLSSTDLHAGANIEGTLSININGAFEFVNGVYAQGESGVSANQINVEISSTSESASIYGIQSKINPKYYPGPGTVIVDQGVNIDLSGKGNLLGIVSFGEMDGRASVVTVGGQSLIKVIADDGNATGIAVQKGALASLSNVFAQVEAKSSDKTAIGIDLDNGQLELTGTNVITAEKGIIATNGSTLSIGTQTRAVGKDNKSSLTVNGVVEGLGTTTNLSNATYTVNGSGSELGTINSNASSTVAFGKGEYNVKSLASDDTTTVLLNDLSDATQITIENKTGAITRAASGMANDQFDNVQDAAKALQEKLAISNDTSAPGTSDDVLIEEGNVNDGYSNGSVTKNTKLDALGSVSALSAMTLRHEMNSLSKRMGELRDAPAGVGTWARYYGSEMEYGTQSLTSKNNTIQVGSDYTVGDWKVGVAANYTDGESSYDNGSADNKNYGLAVYGTWFVPCGAYVDLIAKYSRMDNDFALNGMNGSYENNAFSVSAETGYRFEFMDGGLFVEPQVGVSYGRIMGDDFTAQNGVRVEQDDYDSLIGRVGVRTGFKFPKDKGLIYARVSGLYDFQGEMNATATSGSARNTVEEDLGGAWLELGVGANFNWTNNTYSYIDVERTNGGDVKENYRFNVGIRHTF